MEANLDLSSNTKEDEKTTDVFLLNTGSTINEGRLAKGGSKLTDDYTEECAVCDMNPEDHLSIGSPQKVKITSRDGRHSIAVYACSDDSVSRGHVFMPRAIWSNVVIDPETFSTGSPLYKGAPVLIEPTEEKVMNAKELVVALYIQHRGGDYV